jgi:hypothetical protein
MGRAEGHTELAAAGARVWAAEPAGTMHRTLNAVLGDPASARAQALSDADAGSTPRRRAPRAKKAPGFRGFPR